MSTHAECLLPLCARKGELCPGLLLRLQATQSQVHVNNNQMVQQFVYEA